MADHKVTVYRTQSCPWCHKTMEWLDAHNVPYVDIDVGEDMKAAQHMVEKSGQRGVPVVDIDGEIIVGYDVGAMKKLLDIKE